MDMEEGTTGTGKEGLSLGRAVLLLWYEETFYKAWIMELDIRGISCSLADEVKTLTPVAPPFIDVISEGWEHFATTFRWCSDIIQHSSFLRSPHYLISDKDCVNGFSHNTSLITSLSQMRTSAGFGVRFKHTSLLENRADLALPS